MNGSFNKRGQLEISFGMIVSIILIIIFVSFGIYGITKLLELQKETMTKKFFNDFQEDINKLWKNPIYSLENKSYMINQNVEKVCFSNQEKNLVVYFFNKEEFSKKIENLNMPLILKGDEEKCFYGKNGKFNFILEKQEGETLITIK
jgi:hypothetical protein